MEPLKKRLEKLFSDIDSYAVFIDVPEKELKRNDIRKQMSQSGFWEDNKKAQELSKQESDITKSIQPWLDIEKESLELLELVKLEDDSIENEISSRADEVEKAFYGLKKEQKFRGPYDDHDVILSIYAGAGGTDAQDWAQMLLRMYSRWAEDHKLKVNSIDHSAGEEAGIKSVTIEITGGAYLYGKLAGEHGVHRLVRKSPFNSAGSRETSFAKVDVLPMIDKPEEVLIDDKDLKIDTYRAGGHGGQSVNTTDSAVRVTHIPTGVSVAIQNERSQLQNKETALTILRSRLAQLQIEQHVETLSEIKGPSQANEFGSQIRNYILDDRILKDLRTGYENHDPQKTLDGDLDPLIDAWIESASH